MWKKVLVVIPFTFLVSACSLLFTDFMWPEQAYPRQYFIDLFQADEAAQQYQSQEDYLVWITRFYFGNSLTPGWIGLTEQLLERLESDEHREIVSERLYMLGARIGS